MVAKVSAVVAVLFAPLLGEGACLETRHAFGGDCLKDGDCVSGVCTQLRCAASPPTIDSRPTLAQVDGETSADAPAGSTSDDAGAIAPEAASVMPADSPADILADDESTPD